MDWHTRFVQQSHWTSELRSYLFKRARIEAAQRILEVGCGTGAVVMDLGLPPYHLETEGRKPVTQIHGLDINSEFLSQAAHNAPATRLTLGDAHTLPYVASYFDLVFCHFLLMWVADVHQVLNEIVRVTRPGGFIMALAEPDYGGRIDFPESFVEIGAMQESALRNQGADTRIGRRLRALFMQAGLCKIEAGVMGGQWQENRPTDELVQEWRILKADLNGLLMDDDFNRLRQLDAESWRRGERILFVPTFYAWGQKQ